MPSSLWFITMVFRASMKRLLFPILLLITIEQGLPLAAKVLAKGKPAGGFYWQKDEDKNGKILFQCRSTENGKFQKNANCEKAGAVKP
jgi:hypothetical protein